MAGTTGIISSQYVSIPFKVSALSSIVESFNPFSKSIFDLNTPKPIKAVRTDLAVFTVHNLTNDSEDKVVVEAMYHECSSILRSFDGFNYVKLYTSDLYAEEEIPVFSVYSVLNSSISSSFHCNK